MKQFLSIIFSLFVSTVYADTCPSLLNFQASRLNSTEQVNFCEAHPGKLLLVVNTASNCGYTPQFKGLEALYQKYKDKGLMIVGFPSNDFHQEYADSEKTAKVCYLNYGVTFPMMSKVIVKGNNKCEIYQYLTSKSKNGLEDNEVKWNFQKYLINQEGFLEKVISPKVKPNDQEIIDWIEGK